MELPERDDDFWIGKCLSEQLMTNEPFKKPSEHPLLRRFRDFDQKPEFLGFLGQGNQGIVLSADVNGVRYAIKLFFRFYLNPYSGLDPESWHLYLDPFSNESRAFARLQDINEDGTFAVKCHGWIKLPRSQLDDIRVRYEVYDILTPWALVKELVDTTARPDQLPSMIKNIDIAERCGLYIQDISPSNYGDGKFLDLGISKVKPYPRLYWPTFLFDGSYDRARNRLQKWVVRGTKFVDPSWE